MSKAKELSTRVKGLEVRIDELVTRADEAAQYALEEVETCVQHGWDGVGGALSSAGEALEKIMRELGQAESPCALAAEFRDGALPQRGDGSRESHRPVAHHCQHGRGRRLSGSTRPTNSRS
ncbi:hypothetical protein GCM10027456_68870 [Kineosporia babensis]